MFEHRKEDLTSLQRNGKRKWGEIEEEEDREILTKNNDKVLELNKEVEFMEQQIKFFFKTEDKYHSNNV